MIRLIAKKAKTLFERLFHLRPPKKFGGLSLTGPVRKLHKEQRNFSNGAGFTLIELVVILALLAILVSAAIAALQNITQKAQISQLKATLKSVRSAILIQKANNELNNSQTDGCHPRINFWPTFEEVRRGSYEEQLSASILGAVLPGNPFIDSPNTPPFDNVFVSSMSNCTETEYANPDAAGKSNLSNNLVVCAPQGALKGAHCPASDCKAGWVYSPYTGEFWANSSDAFAEQRSW